MEMFFVENAQINENYCTNALILLVKISQEKSFNFLAMKFTTQHDCVHDLAQASDACVVGDVLVACEVAAVLELAAVLLAMVRATLLLLLFYSRA